MVTNPQNPPKLKRPALFVGLSLLVHLMFVLAIAALSWEVWVPRVKVTWLDLDNRLGAPTPVKVRTVAPPAPTPTPPLVQRPTRKVATLHPLDAGPPRPDAGSPTDAGIPGPALAEMAPGDAALVLALQMDRIRKSPYQQAVGRLLEVFYDHKTLLWSSGLDPVQDFDALLIATPNPYRVTRTFLVVRHHLPRSRIRHALGRGARFNNQTIRWSRLPGGVQRGEIPSPPRLASDPRVVLLRDGLVMLTDPSHIPLLTTDLSGVVPRPGAPGTDAGIRTGQGWLQSLQRMSQPGGSAPAMQLLGVNLPRLVQIPPDIPLPLALNVEVEAVDPTDARATLTFSDESSAQRFLKVIPQRIARAKGSILLRLLGVADLLDGITLRRDGVQVHVTLRLTGDQVRSLLEILRNLIPQVHVPGMPPRRPPDARVPDARVPDAPRPGTDHGAPSPLDPGVVR